MTSVARQVHQAIEPIHAMIYFVPEGPERYATLGLDSTMMGYFASRSAAMGPVGPEVVTATFYVFHPALVASAIPAAWDRATPGQVLNARLRAADEALRRLLPDAVSSVEMKAAAATARQAAESARLQGRALFAAHAALPWPDEPHLQLWHAATLLREFRGDGHVATLLTSGLDPVESMVTYSLSGGVGRKALQVTRQYDDAAWEAAVDRLRSRGWLDAGGSLTDEGRQGRADVEARTDALAEPAYARLDDEAVAQLVAAGKAYSRAITEAGTFPWGRPQSSR